jgi:YfiH family protein
VTAPAVLPANDPVAEFAGLGIIAFTTTRSAGDFGLGDGEPRPDAIARWEGLQAAIAIQAPALASARQVHGVAVLDYACGWDGWRRAEGADGHVAAVGGIACVVTIADCVPVFLAHPSGAVSLLHAGWRGTAGGIVGEGIDRFVRRGLVPGDIHVHLGPAICGRCYEVGPDVFERLTGWSTVRNRHVDLRALLAEQAKALGVRKVTASAWCTRCDNDRFFSHRAGDAARQVSLIAAPLG